MGAFPRAPQFLQDLKILGSIFVASLVIFITAPQPHLRVLRLVPPGDDIQAASAATHVVQRRDHSGDVSRMLTQQSDGRDNADRLGVCCQAGHEGERFQARVPIPRVPTEALELHH